jgi:hypothetical protein
LTGAVLLHTECAGVADRTDGVAVTVCWCFRDGADGGAVFRLLPALLPDHTPCAVVLGQLVAVGAPSAVADAAAVEGSGACRCVVTLQTANRTRLVASCYK